MLKSTLNFKENTLELFKIVPSNVFNKFNYFYFLTIIPRARVGSESIAHEAEGRMCSWLRGHEGE